MQTMTHNNIIDTATFMTHKKRQQRAMWYKGTITDREFVDWLLAHGDDSDVEWLCSNLDPDFDVELDTIKDPSNDN